MVAFFVCLLGYLKNEDRVNFPEFKNVSMHKDVGGCQHLFYIEIWKTYFPLSSTLQEIHPLA